MVDILTALDTMTPHEINDLFEALERDKIHRAATKRRGCPEENELKAEEEQNG